MIETELQFDIRAMIDERWPHRKFNGAINREHLRHMLFIISNLFLGGTGTPNSWRDYVLCQLMYSLISNSSTFLPLRVRYDHNSS